jgi:hypothetical protein
VVLPLAVLMRLRCVHKNTESKTVTVQNALYNLFHWQNI